MHAYDTKQHLNLDSVNSPPGFFILISALCSRFSASSKHGLILLAIISNLFLLNSATVASITIWQRGQNSKESIKLVFLASDILHSFSQEDFTLLFLPSELDWLAYSSSDVLWLKFLPISVVHQKYPPKLGENSAKTHQKMNVVDSYLNCPSDEAGQWCGLGGKMQIGNNFLHLICCPRPQSQLFHLLCKHIEQLFRRSADSLFAVSCQRLSSFNGDSYLLLVLTAPARKGHYIKQSLNPL